MPWLIRLLLLAASMAGGGALAYNFRRQAFARALGLRPPSTDVTVERGLGAAMDDGVTLRCDHYAPREPAQAPVILIRSPYGRNGGHNVFGLGLELCAYRFAERGYHVVIQDVRGRFDSGGEFMPFLSERADGLATLAWLRLQDWYTGDVLLWGASYLGIAAWSIADAPEVKGFIPIFTTTQQYDVVYNDGVLNLGLVLRWIYALELSQIMSEQNLLQAVSTFTQLESRVHGISNLLPLNRADEDLTGSEIPFYRLLQLNQTPDSALWQELSGQLRADNVKAPVHFIAGWQDFMLEGTLRDYQTMKNHGQTPYITIGPWGHFDDFNGMATGVREGLNWFDAIMQGADTRREDPVRIFVTGTDEWRDLPDYPPVTQSRALFLGNDTLLTATPRFEGQRTYRYDPAEPTPDLGGAQFAFSTSPVRDNRELEAREDILTFTTEPLADDLEFIGAPRVVLYVHTTALTTDFYARLCDVQPNGTSLNICDGLYRIQPNAEGLETGDGQRMIEIVLHPAAHRVLTGHRLRLIVGSGAHPRWARNTGTAEPVYETVVLTAADQTVYYGGQTPARVMLPVTYYTFSTGEDKRRIQIE